MLVLGPDGSNVELTEEVLVLRDRCSTERWVNLTEVLTAEVVNAKTLKVHFVDLKEPKLRVKEWTLDAVDEDVVNEFVYKLKECLEKKFPDRPKNLLVFINPGCGNYTGLSIYEKEVDPVFALCGISTEVVVTRRHGDARNSLRRRDLSGIDGVIVIGGDGTFSDAAQGLLERAQMDAEIAKPDDADAGPASEGSAALFPVDSSSNFSWSEFQPAPSSIPVLHVPGGSGNAYATATAGVLDSVTGAIHAALGHVMRTDAISLARLSSSVPASLSDLGSAPSTLAGFSVLMTCFSNLDVPALMVWDQKMRKKWGPFRYFLYPFLIRKEEEMKLRVRYVPAEADDPPSVCRAGCQRCARGNDGKSNEKVWKETVAVEPTVSYLSLTPLRHRFSRFGVLPYDHLGDGRMTFLSISQAARVATILHYARIRVDDFFQKDSSPFFVVAKEMVVEDISTTSQPRKIFVGMEETVDVMKCPVHIRVHRQLLKTYGMGMRDLSGAPTRPSVGVARFLLGKVVKVAVVVAVVVVAYKKGNCKTRLLGMMENVWGLRSWKTWC